MIRKNGRQITFKRTTPGAMNLATGRPAAPSVVTALAYAVVVPPLSRSPEAEKYQPTTLVAAHQRLVYIAGVGMTVTGASGYQPQEGDAVLAIEGRDWKVARSNTWNPDGSGQIFHETVIE